MPEQVAAAPLARTAAMLAPAKPRTVPALQSWRSSAGSFTLGRGPRIVVQPAHAKRMTRTAKVFAADLRAATRRPVTIQIGGVVRRGDIALALNPRQRLGREGYQLRVAGAVRITGRTDAGVFYGTRTVLQLLRQSRTVPGGIAKDWPRYPERGLMVDAGNNYFSPGFFRKQIREMAYLKMNLLHLHLSDNGGFRIQSNRHPEIVAPKHLTKAQVRSIVKLAKAHHITVVPEVDMPGHMAGALRAHPELQLKNAAGKADERRLDVANPRARAFVRSIVSELMPLFPGRIWHIGGDELMPAAEFLAHPALAEYARSRYGAGANAQDAVLGFLNDMNRFVRARGKQGRIWNDGAGGGSAVPPDKSLVVEWWTDFSPVGDPFPPKPQELIDDGHQVFNMGWWPTYYTGGPPRPNMREAYDKWWVHDFYGPLYANSTTQTPPNKVSPDSRRNLGSKVSLWTDLVMETEPQFAAGIWPVLHVVAQKTWESRQPATYDSFTRITAAVGHAPRS